MRWPLAYCPDCGAKLAPMADRPVVLQRCAACGAHHYQNAKPCAGALIARDGHLLLARRGVPPRKGAWDVVGGFLEPDEAPATGAVREALEETGLTVAVGSVVGVHVDRYHEGDEPADYTLNIYCDATPGPGAPAAADDVAELQWFAPDELPEDLAFPHLRRVIADWRLRTLLDLQGGVS